MLFLYFIEYIHIFFPESIMCSNGAISTQLATSLLLTELLKCSDP